MSSPEETQQAADLIERLLTDAAFRGEFRRDPASACEHFGLTELAEELRGGSGAKALYTLELRQSMSSLAGVIMAAAAEGIGALELAGFAKADDKRVAGVVNEALSRHSIKAISRAQMPAVDHDGHGDAVDHEDHAHAKGGHEHDHSEHEHGHADSDQAHGHGHEPKGHEHAPAPSHEDAPAAPHEHAPAPPHEDAPAAPHEDAPAPRPAAPHEDAPAPPHEDAPAAPAPPHEDAAATPAHAPEGFHAADSMPPPSGPVTGGRESGVFAGVAEEKPAVTPTIEAMPAVEEAPPAPAAAAAPPPEQPAEAPPAAAGAPPIEVALGDVPYPGDNAPKPEIAAWMASRAQAAGIPPELPVMAALVESRLSNVNFGDADSIGFFQMRTSIWDTGEYAGYGKDPEKQIKWFIDHAVHEKEKRVADGYTNFLADSSKWGDWIADVERPAEEYRGRYQEQLEEAQALLKEAGGTPAPAAAPVVEEADAHAGHGHGGGGELAEAGGPAVTPSAELAALLENPNLELPEAARADLASGKVDARMVSMLTALTKEHKVGLSVIITGHDQFTSGGSVSNHFVGRGLDIASVDGEIVRGNSIASREVAEAIAGLPESIRPTEVGTPWAINAPGFFTDGNHQDHLHIAYDDEAPAGFAPPAAPAAPIAAATPIAETPPVQVAEAESEGRKSGVFAGVAEAAKPAATPTVEVMPAVEEPAAGQPAAAVAEAVAAPVAAVPGAAAAPIAIEDLNNSNEGGKMHQSEFMVPDAEGAFSPQGRFHAGYDLFAEPGSPVRSPIEGTIVEVKASRGNTGQIFGGVVKVQGADGRVWVFRHVDPDSVSEGAKVTAGQLIARITDWRGGPAHTHMELWKTLEGGYNVSNMEDPLLEMERAYGAPGGGQVASPAPEPEAAAEEHGHSDDVAAAPPQEPAPTAAPSSELSSLLENPNLELPPDARADLASGRVDPRMGSLLAALAREHRVGLSVIKSGHDQFTSGGSVSNHFVGRGLDIASVDGQPVGPGNLAARDVAEAIAALDGSIRPSEVGTPWAINAPDFFTDSGHQDHIHIGWDDPPPAGFAAPAPAAAPAEAVAPAEPAAASAEAPPVPEPESEGRKSGVFAGVAEVDEAEHSGNTVQFMQAVDDDVKAKIEQPPEPDPIAKVPEPVGAGAAIDAYPGDQAPKEQIAAWMAERATAAGIPPELPVMAALVESRLSNINFGDADSIGFFQMRTSIWDQGEYAGYGQDPEKQIKWFLDHAVHEKNKRVEDGYTNFLTDESKWGDWVADVERPAEQYRGRYQERLTEARELLRRAGTS